MEFAGNRIAREVLDADLAQPAVALFHHQVAFEGGNAFDGDLRARGQNLLPVGFGWILHRRLNHSKRLRAVVGADEERIAVVHDIVFGLMHARQEHAKLGCGMIGPDVAHFRSERAADVDQNIGAAGRFRELDRKALISFVINQRICLHAQRVAKNFVRTLGLIEHGVEKRRVVVPPFERIIRVRDLVGEQLAGCQILHVDGVGFVAIEVDRVGQQAVIRTG